MSLYELFLTVHILGAIAWIGSGFLLLVLANGAARAGDPEAIGKIIDDTTPLANRLFIPASLVTLVMGIALTIEGPWSLGHLWIALGLAGLAYVVAAYRAVEPPAPEPAAA
jgi:uncharacterized membrane protein